MHPIALGRLAVALTRPLGLVALLLVLAGLQGCRSGPPPSLVERGEAAYAIGEFRHAELLFGEALSLDSSDLRAIHGQARTVLALHDPEASLRLYAQLARVDRVYFVGVAQEDYPATLYAAAESRLAGGQPGSALKALRMLQKAEPSRRGLADLLGRTLTAQGERFAMHGRREQAMAMFKEAIHQTPQAADPYVGAAEILLASGKQKEALVLLTDARKYNPSDNRVRALTVQAMGLY